MGRDARKGGKRGEKRQIKQEEDCVRWVERDEMKRGRERKTRRKPADKQEEDCIR